MITTPREGRRQRPQARPLLRIALACALLILLTPVRPVRAASVTVSTPTVSVTEGGAIDTYTIVLDELPTGDVTITITPDGQSTTVPTSLTFTTSDWYLEQTVTVTAVDDAVAEGAHTSTISHAASGGGYDGVTASVVANITDNDTAYAIVADQASVVEGNTGGTAVSYTHLRAHET